MEIQPAQKVTLIESVTEQLLSLIRDGHLKQGDGLPSERELMERLKVGRSSVREALRSLATMRVIDIRPGRGAFVRDPGLQDLVPSEALRVLVQRQAMMEIVEAREVLEVELAAMAVERATEEDLQQIRSILDEMEGALGDVEKCLALNAAFHLAIAEAAHNQVLLTMLQSVKDYLEEKLRDLSQDRADQIHSLDGHKRIYEGIRSGDRGKASSAMRDHLRMVRQQQFGEGS